MNNTIDITLNNKNVDLNNLNLDIIQEMALIEEDFTTVQKFHQKSTWNNHSYFNYSDYTLIWTQMVEFSDIIPKFSNESISLPTKEKIVNKNRSHREFNKDYYYSLDEIGEILFNSFGRDTMKSKEYPSAGALYPVIPLVYILDQSRVEGINIEGCYVYDSTNGILHLIKEFNNETKKQVIKNLNTENNIYSNIAIGYSLDLKRAITKYRLRGYRHGLIEVGLMAQNFRHSLPASFGDFSWSGFNDNEITKLSGLNIRLSPVILIQWFGERI